jgi:type I restriction enzyme S subunit
LKVTLEDVVGPNGLFTDGDWVETKDQDQNGNVRLIQLADVGDGNFINKSSRYMNSIRAGALRCTYLEAGDILIARMPDPIGRACIFPGLEQPCVTVVDVCVLRPDHKRVFPKWLLHKINGPEFRRAILSSVTGTTRQRISRGNLSKIAFTLPPLDEQRRIAAILDRAGALRRKRKRSLELLESLKQAIFISMFGDPVRNPMRWKLERLASLCAKITDGTHDTPERVASGVPFITGKNIRPGAIDLSDIEYVDEKTHAEIFRRCNPERGDILLVNIGAGVGNAAINRLEYEFSMKNVALLKLDGQRVTPEFTEQILNDARFKENYLGRNSKGGAQKFLSLSMIKDISLPVPPKGEMERFSECVASIATTRAQMCRSNCRLNASFVSLQHRAFSGQL